MFGLQNFRRRWCGPALLVVLTLLVGCAPTLPRSYVMLVPDLEGAVGQVIVTGPQGRQVLTHAGQVAGIDGKLVTAEPSAAQVDADFSAARAAQPAAPEHFMLYFNSGGTRLTEESEVQFKHLLDRWRSRGAQAVPEVVVIGHTDTVGSDENNLVLSTQRARVVADRLQASGMKFSAITLESHGEKNPLIPTRDGVSEPRNRRVQVTIR